MAKIKILGNLSYQTYPITEDMIEFDDEELKRIGIDKQFIDEKIVDYVYANYEKQISELKIWFNTYYTEHEQKYRRLHSLNVLCDDGSKPYDKLLELYKEAEEKRKQIQELGG